MTMVHDENRTIADVARSLGVNEGTLGNWMSKGRDLRARGTVLSGDERDELTVLRAQIGGRNNPAPNHRVGRADQ